LQQALGTEANGIFDGGTEKALKEFQENNAQRLCISFDQRFIGIEVSGRYIRIYADDTV
jgi:hypothetical protein